MNNINNEFSMKIDGGLDELPHIREFIDRCCKQTSVHDDICFAFKFAVDEIFTNIINYGFKDIESGQVKLKFLRHHEYVELAIIDNGRPFHPDEAQEPDIDASWEDRNIGGLGLYMIKEMMDRIHYKGDTESGNRLTLIKYTERNEIENYEKGT